MTRTANDKENQRVLADRDYWRSFIKDDKWQLLGWTYRNKATFVSDQIGSIELTKAHIEMLGLTGERQMNNLKYTLDGEPVSASDLIHAAEEISARFANDWLKSTSEAARILRENGHSVENAK